MIALPRLSLAVWLGAALVVSVGVGVMLARQLAAAETACEARATEARLQGEISALRGRADLLNAQVALATADRADLMERLDEVHAAEVAALARLRRLVTALPTPTCAPGAARVEAWNSIGQGVPTTSESEP